MGSVAPLSTIQADSVSAYYMEPTCFMDKIASDRNWVIVGRLQGSFGVKGWVRVLSFTEPNKRILEFSEWWLTEEKPVARQSEFRKQKKFKLLSGQQHRQRTIAHLQGIDSLEEAQKLSGLAVWVPRDQLPEPEEGAHYWTDIIGMQVVTKDGNILGVVSHLFATGANDVLVVDGPDGEERLLPFIEEVIQNVDMSAQMITVDLMPGM